MEEFEQRIAKRVQNSSRNVSGARPTAMNFLVFIASFVRRKLHSERRSVSLLKDVSKFGKSRPAQGRGRSEKPIAKDLRFDTTGDVAEMQLQFNRRENAIKKNSIA